MSTVARQIDHLVKMANQIALNLGAGYEDTEAQERIRNHFSRFWTPQMRRELTAYWREGGELAPVAAAALAALEKADRNSSEAV
jgi:formate dehydrogenase subunit delta